MKNKEIKKYYLNTLKEDHLIELIKNNSKFLNYLYELYNEEQMLLQEEEYNLLLDKEAQKTLQYHDNYSSFYFTLYTEKWTTFYNGIDKEYLNEEAIELYNRLGELYNKYINEENADLYEKYEEEAIEISEQLLENIEKQLHIYEDIPSEEELFHYYFKEYYDINYILEDYYITELNNPNAVIYKDITEAFN